MKEKDLTAAIIAFMEAKGWRVMHMLPAMNAGGRILTPYQGTRAKGWPDIFAVRGDRAVAIELKCGKNRVSKEQLSWLSDLRAAGVETYIVFDVDWMAGRLDRVVE